MPSEADPPDPAAAGRPSNAFESRREIRQTLDDLVNRGTWSAGEFETAVGSLAKHGRLALRQLVACHREGRIVDEMAALEVLGRLSTGDDYDYLATVANDPSEPLAARASAALVLLSRDVPGLLTAQDVSSVVLQWQATHLSEEPSLRAPMMQLFASASIEERKSWISMQDRELRDPACRAAAFEMMLEVEETEALRGLLLAALARTSHATSRASLARVPVRGDVEERVVERALRVAPKSGVVPPGWSATAGYCDATGSYSIRFDYRQKLARPRSAIFVVDVQGGVLDCLALSGNEVERYDRLTETPVELDTERESGTAPLEIGRALGLLDEASRRGAERGRLPPEDLDRTRRLLDPLFDVRPEGVERPPSEPESHSPDEGADAVELIDHPAYAAWTLDASVSALDPFRLELLDARDGAVEPGDALVRRAVLALDRSEFPKRLGAMLSHNAAVHDAAGEERFARMALRAATRVTTGEFSEVPLVKELVGRSLHPGHLYLAPPPTSGVTRHDIACLLAGAASPTKVRTFATDLAWIMLRAFHVWAARIAPLDRPTEEEASEAALALARRVARHVTRLLRRAESLDEAKRSLSEDRAALAREIGTVVAERPFLLATSEESTRRLIGMLVDAAVDLVGGVCLAGCPEECPLKGSESTGVIAEGDPFPAGNDAERRIRSWPGPYAIEPGEDRAAKLLRFMEPVSD